MDFGCAAYCKYAEQCLGELTPDLLSKRKDLLKDRVAVEMKKFFRQDFKSINHAMRVARYAEQIAADSENVPIEQKPDLAILLSASYLHGIACPEQGTDGPASGAVCEGVGSVAVLLEGLGASSDLIEEVLGTIAKLRDGRDGGTTKNAKILRDAHTITQWQEKSELGLADDESLRTAVSNLFETEGGRKTAERILLKEQRQ